MALFLVNSLMTISIIGFYLGYFFRKSDQKRHRFFNTIGILANLTAAVYLLDMKYLLGGIAVHQIYPAAPENIIHIHRFFAAIALVLMLCMGYLGWKRKRNLHVKLHYIFLPLYTIVYISGLFLFQSKPL
ncbi:hypothetical protein [Leptospira bandrabouensis]|uniref:hypothetical protein n=1 Tax=Leptospira bandrabouensis TaxID=2484903 RepID=UPI001EE7B6A2|nr:hypothetical protein [Leptospira bandrabouensis]MCG6143380.1 hypothetical protein [Leptospira bandrabouensis]MCG6159040.1 hypothetical protein [Leptospira bandrabouensis]MCG6162974.1 hypothetical protein [Leptospira bandrabouensis]